MSTSDEQQNQDCRNDCIEPLLFPKQVKNRPGLDRISYRIGTYSDFREFMLRMLDREPVLAAWTHRESDDSGIALLESAAILGDILTFYQELYANEAYLRTAQWRESVADLVRLLGYHLSPGIGGKATFAFGVKGTNPVVIPAGFSVKAQLAALEKPVDFETVSEFVAEPALSQFWLYRPFIYPNIKTGVRSFAIATSLLEKQQLKLNKGDRLMLVADPTNPQTARQIAVIAETRQHLDLTEIAIEGSWQGENLNTNRIYAFKLGRSFRYFGYNAPPTVTVVKNDKVVQKSVSFVAKLESLTRFFQGGIANLEKVQKVTASEVSSNKSELFTATRSTSSALASFAQKLVTQTPEKPHYVPPLAAQSFPLDRAVADISTGAILLVSLQLSKDNSGLGTTYFFERKITNVFAATASLGALTGGTTVVQLDRSVASIDRSYTDIRTVEFHEVIGEQLAFTSVRQPDLNADSSHLYFYGDGKTYQKLNGRSIQLVKGKLAEQVTVGIENHSQYDITLYPITLNPKLQKFTLDDFPLDKQPTVVVHGNLVAANQGKTEPSAVLGNGDSRQIFQTFKLPKSPLTYFNSNSETPPEIPELEIYVNDRLWQRVQSLFNRQPKEEIYIVREDGNGDSWVQFGDGKTGARLPSGLNNVVAKYRTGIGAFGAIKTDTTVQGGKLDRLDKIWLPGIATGGEQPETGDNAKEAAPGKIQSLGRLVSLKDFESETLAISGVAKVAASWELVDNIPTLLLTVLMERGREQEIAEIRQILNTYNRCRGPQRFPIYVRPGKLHYVYLDIALGINPTFRESIVTKAVKVALGIMGDEGNGIDGSGGLFGIRQRQFGQPEYATRIAGIIQNIEGVMWVKVNSFAALGVAENPTNLSVPNPKQWNKTVACKSDEILSLYKEPHLQLSSAATLSQEDC
ncbi:MAG: hypothetical protein MUE44_06520 [Oscillatoriaceae cyanobacterium Prado104]|nr:hypothetical protein [Oscillatoriaceae cyanobacterium Prado104]